MLKAEELKLVSEWDKTFPKSEKVDHEKVTFVNRYGITLAADLYKPKNAFGKYPAIAVSGPFGAVKEQCSGLYAQTMAEKGYLTIAFDPSFTGESGGNPRYMVSPDINTEDFMAAIDFLSVREEVDQDRIGIIGICGWGGMALNAAALDTRIKATVASTMYDMTRVNANGYFDSEDSEEARYAKKQSLNTLRTQEYCKGEYSRAGGCVSLPVPEDAPFFVKDYSEYYKGRCYEKRKYKYDDISKMHTYRDALKAAHGAFILYPGTEDEIFYLDEEPSHRDLLYGVGAFKLGPGRKSDFTHIRYYVEKLLKLYRKKEKE